MAVVQISRIQVRRGKSLSGTGLPQLASGELAWSLDTQELYIGNGSVAEGSPAVGNTKILTEHDLTAQGNILNLINHIYKINDLGIQTGPTINTPISRTLQDRFDDYVSSADFGAVGDGVTDDTAALQRAIDQLYLNATTAAYSNIADGVKTRIVLRLLPGIYKTTGTLYIPSYATLEGAGKEKTIISYTGVGPAIQFVNDSSTPGNPSSLGSTVGNSQPRYISLKGFTVYSNTNNQIGLQLDAVRNSQFEDLVIKGNWNGQYYASSQAILMTAVSSLVTCSDNIFKSVTITGFSYGVYAKQDIVDNTFKDCTVYDVRNGFFLGDGADGTTVGQQYGPRKTQIINCKFDNVKHQAVYIDKGIYNTTRDCKFVNVGNDGAGVYYPIYPQVYLGSVGNTSQNDQSDRAEYLSTESFTVNLTLSRPITASRGDTVYQAVTGVTGTLKQDYVGAASITLVTKFLTSYDNTHKLTIAGNPTPGNSTSITVTGSNTTTFTTSNTTLELTVGTAVTFSGTLGGVVIGTTYYVQDIPDASHFSISDTLGGPQRPLSVSNGNMVMTFAPVVHPTIISPLSLVPYIPEVTGYGTYSSYATRQVTLGYITSPSLVSTLPISTGAAGNPTGSISYKIDYTYKSSVFGFTRTGTITLEIDLDASINQGTTVGQLSDDYNVYGISEVDSLKLEFSMVLLNQTGNPISLGDTPYGIALKYVNVLQQGLAPNIESDHGVIDYSYKATCLYNPLIV